MAKATNTSAVKPQEVITIPAMQIRNLQITLIGDSPLIVHRWSEKVKKEMLDKQMKKAKVARAAKDPEAEFKESLYTLPGGKTGFPTIGVKAAAVSACSHVSEITKVAARGAFHVDSEFVVIEGEPTMREDIVRVGMGNADLRYRGEYRTWRTTFTIRYNANVLSAEQILNLFDTAGFAIGLGEWRPQKNGQNGLFHVQRSEE